MAIDATDFSSMPSLNYQYSKKAVRREICKANVGFEGAGLEADEDTPIVSGRWGCGAFDPVGGRFIGWQRNGLHH